MTPPVSAFPLGPLGQSPSLFEMLDSDVTPTFKADMQRVLPMTYAALYDVILGHFQMQKKPGLFERNTCALPASATDLRIYRLTPPGSKYKLYTSTRPKAISQETFSSTAGALKLAAAVVAKCTSRALPLAAMLRPKNATAVPYRWECVDVPRLRYYAFVERGPQIPKR